LLPALSGKPGGLWHRASISPRARIFLKAARSCKIINYAIKSDIGQKQENKWKPGLSAQRGNVGADIVSGQTEIWFSLPGFVTQRAK
jgi:hypothetical protein